MLKSGATEDREGKAEIGKAESGNGGPRTTGPRDHGLQDLGERAVEAEDGGRGPEHRTGRISDSSEAAAVANHLVGRSAGSPPRARFENLLETYWRNAPAEDLDLWNCTKIGHSSPRLPTVSPPYPLHLPSLSSVGVRRG